MSKNNLKFNRIVILGFILFVLAIIMVVLAPLGSRVGVWSFDSAVVILTVAAYIGICSLVISIVGGIQSRPGKTTRGFYFSLSVIIIMIPTLLFLMYWKNAKHDLPPIQDITTNTEQPPQFWTAPNSKVYGGVGIAAYQQEAYPDIQPLILSAAPDKIFDTILNLIKKNGWLLWESNREEKHIEATDTTFWFGFSDDIVFHISTTDSGSSRIDIRSTSRFGGGGDGGTNARRIRSILHVLKIQLKHEMERPVKP